VRPDAAEDAAQEALLRAFANLAALRKLDSFSSWVLGMAYRVLKERADNEQRERAGLRGHAAHPGDPRRLSCSSPSSSGTT